MDAKTASGSYRVYASWSTDTDRPTNAPFTIHHAGDATTVWVDMHTTHSSGWNLLGGPFTLDVPSYVDLTDNGAEVVADAIKLVHVCN